MMACLLWIRPPLIKNVFKVGFPLTKLSGSEFLYNRNTISIAYTIVCLQMQVVSTFIHSSFNFAFSLSLLGQIQHI